MATNATTIKVSRELRDRIAERAHADHVSLAAAISHALDLADRQEFWSATATEHAALSESERAAYRSDATLGDDLADADDDAVTAADAW